YLLADLRHFIPTGALHRGTNELAADVALAEVGFVHPDSCLPCLTITDIRHRHSIVSHVGTSDSISRRRSERHMTLGSARSDVPPFLQFPYSSAQAKPWRLDHDRSPSGRCAGW